jgi:hypothetical protein
LGASRRSGLGRWRHAKEGQKAAEPGPGEAEPSRTVADTPARRGLGEAVEGTVAARRATGAGGGAGLRLVEAPGGGGMWRQLGRVA